MSVYLHLEVENAYGITVNDSVVAALTSTFFNDNLHLLMI